MTTASAEATTPFQSHVELILDFATVQPDRVLISDASRPVTAAQLRWAVRNAAADLLARGISPGQIVALAAPICLEAVVVRYAAGLIGCATTVCPNATDPVRLKHFVDAVRADVLICFPGTAEVADAWLASDTACPVQLITGVELDEEGGTVAARLAQLPDVDADALGVLVTSGGTTGESKASRRSFADWRQALAIPPCPTRRQLICTPLPYIAQILMDQVLLNGGSVVLRSRFDPAEVLQTIETERITHLCLVEPELVDLADHPDVADRDLSSLVAISHIGADAAPSLRRRLLARLGRCLAHPYGASEAGLISVLAPGEYESELASVGRILPGVQVRIESSEGDLVGASQVGRVLVRSTGVAHGYAGGRASAAFRADGWYDTGDCGYLDAEGWLSLRGRAVDERWVGGVSTFPVDLQDLLCGRPEVAYAVAWPTDDGADGFDAVVVPVTAISPDQLGELARSHPGLNRLLIGDHVPITEQGKPDRVALQALLEA